MSRSARRPTIAALLLASLLAAGAAHAQTAWHEGFEAGQPSWRPSGGDAQYRILQHQRLQGDAHTGNGCEWLRLEADGGSCVYIAHDVGRPAVIDDLAVSVWLRSDRPGLQLAARVVLPRSADPRTGRAVTAFVAGSRYTDVGRWQQLRLGGDSAAVGPRGPPPAHAARPASRRARSLRRCRAVERLRRAGHDQRLDRRPRAGRPRECGAGAEPAADGPAISAVRKTRLPPGLPKGSSVFRPSAQASPPHPKHTVRLSGSVLLVDGRPMFPRIIQHRGEPLAVLKKIGFNAVWLQRLPGPELLEEADRLGLWLICPPPPLRKPPTVRQAANRFAGHFSATGVVLRRGNRSAVRLRAGLGPRRRSRPGRTRIDPAVGGANPCGRPAGEPAAGLPPAERAAGLQPAGRPAADRPPPVGHQPRPGRLRGVGPPAAALGEPGHARLDHRADAAQRGVAAAGCGLGSRRPAPAGGRAGTGPAALLHRRGRRQPGAGVHLRLAAGRHRRRHAAAGHDPRIAQPGVGLDGAVGGGGQFRRGGRVQRAARSAARSSARIAPACCCRCGPRPAPSACRRSRRPMP